MIYPRLPLNLLCPYFEHSLGDDRCKTDIQANGKWYTNTIAKVPHHLAQAECRKVDMVLAKVSRHEDIKILLTLKGRYL